MTVNMMFTPPNPNFERTVRDVFAQQQLMVRLGASLVVVGPGYAELELPCSAVMSWREGHFASSAVAVLAESAGDGWDPAGSAARLGGWFSVHRFCQVRPLMPEFGP